MKRIPRRTSTAKFKAEAVKLATEQNLTHAEVSRRLDIGTKSLRTWTAQQSQGTRKASLGADKLTPDQMRIHELEREFAIAKMERDIKKATGAQPRVCRLDECANDVCRHASVACQYLSQVLLPV